VLGTCLFNGAFKLAIAIDVACGKPEGHGDNVDLPLGDSIIYGLYTLVLISFGCKMQAVLQDYLRNHSRVRRLVLSNLGYVQFRIGRVVEKQTRSTGTVSIAIMNHIFEPLVDPVVLAFDLLVACVHVWMRLIDTSVENCDLDRRLQAILQTCLNELLVDSFEVTFPY
jgi:hypothetical protein